MKFRVKINNGNSFIVLAKSSFDCVLAVIHAYLDKQTMPRIFVERVE